jgi:coiled-coil-helix-coiled-coil-helix domain-containing protein 10
LGVQRSRRGGGGGFGGGSSRPASSSARPQQSRSVPAPRPAAPPPATQQASGGGMLSGIGSTIAQGMAFGTGSAIAHRAVGAVAGAMSGGGSGEAAPVEQYSQPMQQQQQIQGACASDKQMFFECLQVNKGDQQSCSFLYDNLQACQRGDNSMSFN